MAASSATPLLGPGKPASTAIRAALGLLAIAVFVTSAVRVVTAIRVAVDLIIPLHAAKAWLAGDVVYVTDSLTDLQLLPPFLYPPFVLPVIAPLTLLPELLVRWTWFAVMLGTGVCA